MISELETELIEAIQSCPITPNLRKIGPMPDGDAKTLIRTFFSTSPAVYVIAGSTEFNDDLATVRFDLLCLAKNARGFNAARHGDGQTIGLYQMLDHLSFYLESFKTTSAVWNVKSLEFAKADIWRENGLYAGSLKLMTKVHYLSVDPHLLSDNVGDFITFNGDFDIEPFVSKTEHEKWLKEPPDFNTSKADLIDVTTMDG